MALMATRAEVRDWVRYRYRDDAAQTVQHFSFIAAVEELLDLDAIERLGGAACAAGGRGGIEGELSG